MKTDNKQEANTSKKSVEVPNFNADSAYYFIEKQLSFGPRVPNTQAHENCGDWLVAKLKEFTPEVIEQRANLKAFDGTILNARNIIASFNPDATSRILLCSHWDSRPWADHDPDPANHKKPVPAANDGASGVGVLIEIARNLSIKNPGVGVDIVLFDAEDYGEPHDIQGSYEDSWALGSQHWAANPHVPGYSARFGILLDMVGAKNATFGQEYYSMYYAPNIVRRVWSAAERLGYGDVFIKEKTGPIVDDHYYVNEILRVPTIDIIDYKDDRNKGFFEYWHTLKDDMDYISKETLKAVGQTVITVVYESAS
jgi:Zn-dependent M28 family amino/carboxypeptidase